MFSYRRELEYKVMRYQLLKLSKRTKAERRIGEILKKNKIKFKVGQRIGKYEIDFVVGRVVIEVDGNIHKRINRDKDIYLASIGYVPLHISAYDSDNKIIEELVYLIGVNNYERRIKTRD